MRQNFGMTDVLQFLLFFWLGPGWLCTKQLCNCWYDWPWMKSMFHWGYVD